MAECYCPKDCHFFTGRIEAGLERLENERETRKKERGERRYQIVVKGFQVAGIPFRWFGQLHWQTQIAMIVLAILIIAPKWVPLIIALVKAFTGRQFLCQVRNHRVIHHRVILLT